MPGGRGRLPMRPIVAVLSLLLLFGTGTHIAPAIRAGLRDGTHGSWVATARTCVRHACTWQGKFVLPSGHVLLTSVEYLGQLPRGIHAGTAVAGLYPGGSHQIFPATGSDLWISLLIAMAFGLLGLYWSSHRVVRNYLAGRPLLPGRSSAES